MSSVKSHVRSESGSESKTVGKLRAPTIDNNIIYDTVSSIHRPGGPSSSRGEISDFKLTSADKLQSSGNFVLNGGIPHVVSMEEQSPAFPSISTDQSKATCSRYRPYSGRSEESNGGGG